MAVRTRTTRLGVLGAAALFAMIPTARAQLLPDVGGSLRDTVRDIDREVEESVERPLENDFDGILKDRRSIDGVSEIRPSAVIGNTLNQTLEHLGDVAGAVPGVVQLPTVSRPTRAVDLDRLNGDLVVRNEWVVLVPSARANQVASLDINIIERADLAAADETLFIVSLTSTSATAEAVEAELASLGAQPFDRNHVYRGAAGSKEDSTAAPADRPAAVPAGSPGNLRIGLIDTDLDETHPDLSGLALYEADFVSMGQLRPQTHGTAVASILARQSKVGRPELLAASAFFLSNDGTTGATSASLIEAIDWLQAHGAGVINVSLTGPPNRALEAVIASRQKEGIVFVAAVGNEGPASGPLYPAAYDGVVGVTAVDASGRVYRWANRGSFVDVAALGVDVSVARPGVMQARDSGTSFAAPVVSAFLGGWTGAKRVEPGSTDELIRASAGPKSSERDDTFGYGILSP